MTLCTQNFLQFFKYCNKLLKAGLKAYTLANAQYLYGIALNRTLEISAENALIDGRSIIRNTFGTFDGMKINSIIVKTSSFEHTYRN